MWSEHVHNHTDTASAQHWPVADSSADQSEIACYRNTAKAAYGAVEIPEGVIDLLTGLRDYLQDKCEPPVYVSDRRFMKSIQMLQVAAYADGRDSVSALSLWEAWQAALAAHLAASVSSAARRAVEHAQTLAASVL